MKRVDLLLILGHLGWFVTLALPSTVPVEMRLAPFAAALAMGALVLHRDTGKKFRPCVPDVVIGLVSGLLLAVLTHVGAAFLFSWFPGVEDAVRELYGEASVDNKQGILLLSLLVVVIVSEEIIWRGAVLDRVATRLTMPGAVVVSSGAYAAAAMGLGSPMLGAAAFGMGLVWTVLAAKTGRLMAPVLSHLTWDLVILVIYPL